jgi:hypothetical protein
MYSTAYGVKDRAVRRGRQLANCGTGKPGLEVRRSAAGRGREQVEDVELEYMKDRYDKMLRNRGSANGGIEPVSRARMMLKKVSTLHSC